MKHRTHAIIDNNALLNNIQRIKQFAPYARIIAMVKANAYGHDASRVSSVIEPEIDIFGVACLREALKLRATAHKPILIMGGVFSPEEWEVIWSYSFDVVLHHVWQVDSLLSFLSKKKFEEKKINIWIKIDTGMHRLGFEPKEVPSVYDKLYQCPFINKPIGLMTHFACSDECNSFMTSLQINSFQQILDNLSQKIPKKEIMSKISLANSAAIMIWPDSYGINPEGLNYVRPGIMLYGISPFADKTSKDLGLQPVMTLESHIIAIKTCKKGESVGYGATWLADKDYTIAIVAAGYGDGYPRHISGEAVVWAADRYLPIIGRVAMDMLVINVSSWPEVKIGDSVELWGKHLPVEWVARFANTSPYELVTQITVRARL